MGIVRRTFAGVAVAGFAVAALSACLSLDLTTTVSTQGTFTGTSVMTFDKGSVQEFGITDLSQAQAQLGVPDTTTDQVAVTWSETDAGYVQTVTYSDATPAQIEDATSASSTQDGPDGAVMSATSFGFPLRATASGDQMVVSLSENTADAARDSSPAGDSDPQMQEELAEMLFGDSALELDITMPGQIESVRGVIPDAAQRKGAEIEVTQTDQTLRVSAPFAALVALEETAQGQEGLVVASRNEAAPSRTTEPSASPTAAAGAEPTDQTSTAPAAIAMGAAGLLALVAVLVLLLRRRRQGTSDNDSTPGPETGA